MTTADKGGGVVLMDYSDYKSKMFDLLSDTSTYKKTGAGHADKESKHFNQKARKIMNNSTQEKKLQYLLEEKPAALSMRGLPKTHKQGNPMRPITLGVGSAPHQLAKRLARPLSDLLGTMSVTHCETPVA